jgi:NDP-sugar pyrophosphorylase family protein
MMKCVILCGGRGTRLMPLTKDTKKAFLSLGKKKVFEHIIDKLPKWMPYSISLNDDGAIAALAEVTRGEEPVMVVCGDNFFSHKLDGFVSAFEGETLIGIYEVESVESAKHYGVVELSPGDGRIKLLLEKPSQPKTKLVSTGLYIFPPHVFSYIHDMAALTPHGNLGAVIKHIMDFSPVHGFRLPGVWIDIGTIEGYNLAKNFVDGWPSEAGVEENRHNGE